MSYTNQALMTDAYGADELIQLTDRAGTGSIDADVLDAAIAAADQEIDLYTASRFAALGTPVPAIVSRIAGEIARFYLYEDACPEIVEKRYKNAIKMLEQIRDGALALGEAADLPEKSAGSVWTGATRKRGVLV